MLSSEEIGRIFAGENPIQIVRENRGLTLRQLALRTGIDRKLLQEFEAGKRKPSVGREQVIARELGVHPITLRPCRSFEECAERLRRIPDDD